MPKYGTEVKLKSDILDFKSDILFLPISATDTFLTKKKDITQKKRISVHISCVFLGQNTPIISGKKVRKTAKNGVQKETKILFSTFSKSEVSVVVYFRKKTCDFFFLQKICQKRSVPWEIHEKQS